MVTNRIASLALLIIMVSAIGFLSGCASPAATKAMVTDRIPMFLGHPYTVSIRTQGGTETSAAHLPSISNDDFAKAIEESIIKSGLFTNVIHGKNSDYTLNVTIIYMSKPLFGARFTLNIEAAWSLVKTVTQDIVMRESIKSSYTATMEDAFVGATRFRLAVEGAARENIRLGLLSISKLQLQ
jgi:hypothetical protein